jgi:hypothetical protein
MLQNKTDISIPQNKNNNAIKHEQYNLLQRIIDNMKQKDWLRPVLRLLW